MNMSRIKKARIWLACKILGNTPLISNVTFYQTICLDVDSVTITNNTKINIGHELKWVEKSDGIGMKFDYYEASINGTYDERIEANLKCEF